MHRTLVGLLAAVSATASAVLGLAHGDMIPFAVVAAVITAGVAAGVAASSKKNLLLSTDH
jgi:hypothetical protein